MEQSTQSPAPEGSKQGHEPVGQVHVGSGGPSRLKISIAVVAALVLVGAIVATLLLTGKQKDNKAPAANQTAQQNQQTTGQQTAPSGAFAQQYLQGCKDRDVSFTASPVPMSQMGHIEPMGKVSDGHVTPTDHVYISPLNTQAADNTYDVVMPADGTVTTVAAMPAQYIGDMQQQTAAEDHRLIIQHNCRYVSIFIHVHQLSDALKNAVGGALAPNTSKQVSIALKAGDKLGKIGGNPVDWTLADANTTLSGFITPKLYEGESWKIHSIDPLSVYSGDLRTQLIAKSVRTVEPYGGKIDYDKKGALVGNWFREGTNGYSGADQSRYYDGHLSIAPNYIDPNAVMYSTGNWQGKAQQLVVKAPADPSGVTAASGAVKYELIAVQYALPDGSDFRGSAVRGMTLTQKGELKGTVLLQVLDGEKLKVEQFPGKSAAQVSGFSGAAQTYVR